MKKAPFFLIPLFLFLAFGFAACGGTQTPASVPTSAVEEFSATPQTEAEPAAEPTATPAVQESVETGSGPTVPFEPVAGDTPMEGCTVSTLLPAPDPAVTSRFPAVSETDWVRGPSGAAVTIVEYSDFQCVVCGQLALVLNLLQQEFPNDLRVVYRHYPLLNSNDKAGLALQAAEAAGQQDKFWEMHDVMFTRQQEWASLNEQDFNNWLNDRNAEIGLNNTQYAAAMFAPGMVNRPNEAYAEAVALELPGAPFLLINGEIYDGPVDYVNLGIVIRLYALQARQYSACPPMIIDPSQEYIATIETPKGNIVVKLFADKAPRAVNNFVFLATHDWYDNVTFHRVLQDFMAQAGDPSGTGYGGPGYAFQNENSGESFNREGLLAMANAGPDTNGSQFFITVMPTPHLDGGYTIFGEVIEGMDVVKSLTLRDPAQGFNLPAGDAILNITIEQR
jgi:cyclophilin family peptidyl-prolyl cis-trans isomerase/protein-disulfide isomerase